MRLFSYIITRDYGFAPNPFHGYCTLATCKPTIRKAADIGDIIVGIGSGAQKSPFKNRIIYVMRVTEKLTYDEYWKDERFNCKIPNMHGSKKQMYGDNIYHTDDTVNRIVQEDSHHSLEGGLENSVNYNRDVPGKYVLISDKFCYWGGEPIDIPERFLAIANAKRYNFITDDEIFIVDFIKWIKSLNCSGYIHKPYKFANEFERYNGK